MRILIVSLFFPQKNATHAGGRYVYELLKYLSQDHEVYLATRIAEHELSSIDSLMPYCRKIFPYPYKTDPKRGIFDIIKLLFNYIGFSSYADRLIRKGKYDLAQIEWVEAALLIRRGKTPMVLDAHDVISKPAERELAKSRGIKRFQKHLAYWVTKKLELNITRRFQIIFARSEFDKNYLLKMDNTLKVITVPHPAGLDISKEVYKPEENNILFLASYKYRQVNVEAALWFYREVLPLIRREVPEIRFTIAGYGPPEELTSLAEKDSHVSVPGYVDDLDRCYKEAAVFVAPILTGGGIIVKILDALAAGTPVVTTSFGNEGIGAVSGRDLLVADAPEEFATAVIKVLRSPKDSAIMANNGREFVSQQYGLEVIMSEVDSAYQDLIFHSQRKASV